MTSQGGAVADLSGEPPQVRDALSALGRLLGAALIHPPRNLRSFITSHLATSSADVASVGCTLRGIDVPLVQVAVARLLESSPSAVLTDDLGDGTPGYELVTVDVDEQVAAPDDIAAFIPADEGFGFDAVIVLTWENSHKKIELYARRCTRDAARHELSVLLSRARDVENFYRGKTIEVVAGEQHIVFTPVAPSAADRADLVLGSAVWREIDANVGGLVAHGDLLVSAGLGASRGLLVAGPPGVGKTALCRVIAGELPTGTTKLIVDSGGTSRGLALVYESLARLAPAAVFLDDLDLLAGDRRSGTSGAGLRELLTHLDGFMPAAAVLTVATTNDTNAIDPALTRAGRFDAVIEIDVPDRDARERILRRCLRTLGEFDVAQIAAVTDGLTGADLREVVRRGVLERGPQLSSAALLDIATSGRWRPDPPAGQYL